MSRTIGFMAGGRNEVCAITRWLMSYIDPEFLNDPDSPIKIAVNGTQKGGKKIIPDAAREYFYTWEQPFTGRGEYDEYIDTPSLSFAFINVSWPSSEFSRPTLREFNSRDTLTEAFLAGQKNGGIAFIHNSLVPRDWADIEIELRDELDILYNTGDPSYRDELRVKLTRVSNRESEPGTDGIRRLLRITINSDRLLNNPSIQNALSRFDRNEPVFESAIEDDDLINDVEAVITPFIIFDHTKFKPRLHPLASPPSTWHNAPFSPLPEQPKARP